MRGPDLVLVLRSRKAVTYGFHVLLGALGQHETATRYEVRFGENVEETARHIREAGDSRVLVLWSFYSPDAAALAEEPKQIRALADGPNVTDLAGGVHATAEPVQTLDAGWDMAAIGEGESTSRGDVSMRARSNLDYYMCVRYEMSSRGSKSAWAYHRRDRFSGRGRLIVCAADVQPDDR
jgi:radical SAM superfamily enzyme YgiQ (UPF0313 family)